MTTHKKTEHEHKKKTADNDETALGTTGEELNDDNDRAEERVEELIEQLAGRGDPDSQADNALSAGSDDADEGSEGNRAEADSDTEGDSDNDNDEEDAEIETADSGMATDSASGGDLTDMPSAETKSDTGDDSPIF